MIETCKLKRRLVSSAEEKLGRLVVRGAGACMHVCVCVRERMVTCGGTTDGHTRLTICWPTELVCFGFGAEGNAATDKECPPGGGNAE